MLKFYREQREKEERVKALEQAKREERWKKIQEI